MQTDDKIKNVDGMAVVSEEIGFGAEELISCGDCRKPNPPNRLNCLYCGAALELPAEVAAEIRFQPAQIEDWEPGVNIICLGGMDIQTMEAARRSVALGDLPDQIAAAGPPVPIARVRAEEADEVAARLASAGLEVSRVEDRSMGLGVPPVRLKGIVFEAGSLELILFGSDEVDRIGPADVCLIVTGAIFKSSSEATLKKTRKETKHVDERFDASDHSVIDIYTSGDHSGYRILPHGFDFSCLGPGRSLLAVENLRGLKDLFRSSFPNAVFDDSYLSKLPILDRVWPRTRANTSKGMQRVGWKIQRSVGESISNEEQFTRYSRMRRELI